jgi:2-dehydro-3-deoxyglucarate aldolase/4-hydroxy-2-oxoheptanedioate aldolase
MGNRIKEKLRADEVVLGQMLLEMFTPGMAYMLANCGLEFVLYDMEHGRCDLALLSSLITSAQAAGIVSVVRVPDIGVQPLSRVLDLGARGVMVPRVETAAQMQEIVALLKYAPEGRRGVALGVAHDNYKAAGPSYLAEANRDVLVIALLETARAFENLDAIIATPGLDVAWVGHYDLTASLGIPGQFDHPVFLECMRRVVFVSRQHGVAPGFLPANAADTLRWIKEGFRMISLGSDIGVYQAAMRAFRAAVVGDEGCREVAQGARV